MGFLNDLYEKQKGKLAAQIDEHLEPGESLEKGLLARADKRRRGKQVAVFASDRNIYLADVGGVSSLKAPGAAFPIAKAGAHLDERGAVALANYSKPVLPAEEESGALYEHFVLYPEKSAGSDPQDLVQYINERTTAPEPKN